MILKGSQRSGARQLSEHLLNDRDNDHVSLCELRGFVARDLHGALAESYAISKGTRCKQFLFSLSLNPPKQAAPTEAMLLEAAEKAEKRLGLEGQPRAIIIHEKEGRRHAHAVWSRIDPESMKAINLPHFKRKLTALSRELYLEHGWKLPDGLRRDGGRSPLNFSHEEWQQAKRLKLDPQEIKQSFLDAWARSDGVKAFSAALAERGYFLARGDRRGFVALDIHGEVYAVSRLCDVRTKDVKAKLGEPDHLPGVAEVEAQIASRVTDKLRSFIEQAEEKRTREAAPAIAAKAELIKSQRAERAAMLKEQKTRLEAENRMRAARIRKGLRGLWDTLTGKAKATRQQNEAELAQALKRDREERDRMAFDQLQARRAAQDRLDLIRRRQVRDRLLLEREIASRLQTQRTVQDHHEHERGRDRRPRTLSHDR